MTQRKPPRVTWESFVERQICEAQEAGEFDDLPGFGKPLVDLGEFDDESWWLKRKLRREKLSLLPPALQIRRDVEQTIEACQDLRNESEVREAIGALNERIRQANIAAIWGPPSTVMPLDVHQVLLQWRSRRTASA